MITSNNEVPPLEANLSRVGCLAMFWRFIMMENVYELRTSQRELDTVEKVYTKVPPENRKLSTRYLIWRKSTLVIALIPYGLSIILNVNSLTKSLNRTAFLNSIFPDSLNNFSMFDVRDYHVFFSQYYTVSALVDVTYSLSLVVSFLCTFQAIRVWSMFGYSKKLLKWAYLFSFATPYLLLLIAPFKQSVDGDGLAHKFCLDGLEGLNTNLESSEFSCQIDNALCKSDPNNWNANLRKEFDKCGVLRDRTGSCPFAAQFASTLIDSSSGSSSGITSGSQAVETICGPPDSANPAFGYCTRCLQETDKNGNPYCANLFAAMNIQSIYENCERCLQPLLPQIQSSGASSLVTQLTEAGVTDNMHCGMVCVAGFSQDQLKEQIALKASSGQNYCINEEQMDDIAEVTELALQIDKITYAVGLYQAAVTLITLFPASFSLMYGSIRGSSLCKMMLPWSRLPGYFVGASIVYCLPMFTALLAVVYQMIGDYYCCAAFMCLIFSLLIWLPERRSKTYSGTLAPQTHSQASKEFTRRGYFSLALKLACGVFFILFVNNLKNSLDSKEVKEVSDMLKSAKGNIIIMTMTVLFDCYGKAYLAFVFCADTTTFVVGKITTEDLSENEHYNSLRNSEMLDIASLNTSKRGHIYLGADDDSGKGSEGL